MKLRVVKAYAKGPAFCAGCGKIGSRMTADLKREYSALLGDVPVFSFMLPYWTNRMVLCGRLYHIGGVFPGMPYEVARPKEILRDRLVCIRQRNQ